MSLYNMVNNVHPTAGYVLEYLGIDAEDCGRFRDAYITSDGKLAIFTRCGGENYQDYPAVYDRLAKHPCFLRYEFDHFDSTYFTFYFSTPKEYKEKVASYIALVENSNRQDLFLTPIERFQKMIDRMA